MIILASFVSIFLFFKCFQVNRNEEQSKQVEVLWSPPPEDIEYWSNRAPFRHCPTHTKSRNNLNETLERYLQQIPSTCVCPPSNVLVLFVDTNNTSPRAETMLEATMRACGCTNLERAHNDSLVWDGFKTKIDALQAYTSAADRIPLRVEYLLYLDAHDTALVGDASAIVADFHYYQAEFLMCPTLCNCPRGFEFSPFEDLIYPWSQYHKHPSAGGFMATVSTMRRYMEMVQKQADERLDKEGAVLRRYDDQCELKRLHMKRYPRMKVDSLARICTRQDWTIGLL